jgi:hypothetical protein
MGAWAHGRMGRLKGENSRRLNWAVISMIRLPWEATSSNEGWLALFCGQCFLRGGKNW